MFNNTDRDTRPNDIIDIVHHRLLALDPSSPEFATLVDQFDKLYKIHATTKPDRVSKETLATIAANLGGIVAILSYEHAHVLGSKALGFVLKSKL